ncbi:spore germination protein [Cytobacillus sp. FJAT-54145]|uniref:Spore germination protein n=1 Tax=Cytobacillus spartinae TaxID=3299023 RepID=A0ABW6K8R7_9BACI
MMVSHINNILGIRINSISSNGSLNFGNVLHKGQQANLTVHAGYLHAGDANLSPLKFDNTNNINDPDVQDQIQSQY